jgi:hypothetical protein
MTSPTWVDLALVILFVGGGLFLVAKCLGAT